MKKRNLDKEMKALHIMLDKANIPHSYDAKAGAIRPHFPFNKTLFIDDLTVPQAFQEFESAYKNATEPGLIIALGDDGEPAYIVETETEHIKKGRCI